MGDGDRQKILLQEKALVIWMSFLQEDFSFLVVLLFNCSSKSS